MSILSKYIGLYLGTGHLLVLYKTSRPILGYNSLVGVISEQACIIGYRLLVGV